MRSVCPVRSMLAGDSGVVDAPCNAFVEAQQLKGSRFGGVSAALKVIRNSPPAMTQERGDGVLHQSLHAYRRWQV